MKFRDIQLKLQNIDAVLKQNASKINRAFDKKKEEENQKINKLEKELQISKKTKRIQKKKVRTALNKQTSFVFSPDFT